MRKLIVVCMLLLTLVSTMLSVHAAPQAGTLPEYTCASAQPALITIQGSGLSSGPLRGATIYDTPWHSNAQSYIDARLSEFASEGWNLVRPTDQWNSGDNPYDPTIWANMDYLVCKAASMGMYVQLDLSGYQKVLQGQGLDPWNASNWTNFIDTVVAHYHDVNNISVISVQGEPKFPSTQAEADSLTAFYRTTIGEVERVDGHRHLVIAGGLITMQYGVPDWWKSIFALEDLAAFKIYSLADEQYIPTIRAATTKPLLNDEFGMPQSMGDATWSGQTYNGLQVSRSSFFKTVIGYGFPVNIVWNQADVLSPTVYDVNPQTPAAWAALKITPPPPPSFTCAAVVNGVLKLGTCTGTFTAN